MKFRILIHKDPAAKSRGYSLQGIKVPLTSFCPIRQSPSLLDLNNKPTVRGLHEEFWKIPVESLVKAKPELWKHLRGIDFLAVPVEWCDVAPIDDYNLI